MSRILPTLAICAAVVGACAPAVTSTAATTSAPSDALASAPRSSTAASPAPTGLGSSGSPAIELPPAGELARGSYTRAAFIPRITFEVGEGWRSGQAVEGFFDIQRDVAGPDVIAVQFARPDGVYGADGTLVAPASAEAAAGALDANPALKTLDSSDSRMSGLEGFVVEVENPSTASAPAQVLQAPAGAVSIDPSRRLWIALFDTPEGIVAILVGGSVAGWDEALAAAEPVLETVTIGD